MTQNLTGEIKNPLAGLSKEELFADVEEFAEKNNMKDYIELLRKGALVAQNPGDFENLAELNGKSISELESPDKATIDALGKLHFA